MRFAAYGVLLAALVLWSGNWIVGRAVRDEISPALATLGRILVVLAVLAPFAARGLAVQLAALTRADWKLLAAAGVFGGGVHLAMQWQGLQFTTATSATLFLSTSPIFILMLAPFALGERVAPLRWLGVGVSFAGVAVIACRGEPAAIASLAFNVGDLFALGSMAMWAAYTVTLQRRSDRLGTAQFLLVIALIGLVTLLPWVAWELAHDARARLTPPGVAALLYSALGSFLLAYLGWGYAVKRIGAGRTGAWMHLMPAIGVGLAAAFLGEYPSWFHFAGIALIFAGIGLSSISR